MTREEAIEFGKRVLSLTPFDELREFCEIAVKSLEQEPCEDCIRREDALMALTGQCAGSPIELLPKAIKRINALPPVTPQTKMGRWEYVQYDSNPNIGNWHCSECRTIIPHMPEETDNTPIYKWCPMCGAKMEVEE